MAKNYTESFLREQRAFNNNRLGVQFGKLCVAANLPPTAIANALGVTRQTVYNWFRGNAVRGKNIDKIEKLTGVIKEALDLHKLPAPNAIVAQQFITDNIIS